MSRTEQKETVFSIGQASQFFDQSPQWLRWRESQGFLIRDDGTPIALSRKESSKMGGGDRRYSITDIREIAHALRRNGIIDNEELKAVLRRVDAFDSPIKTARTA